MSPPCEARAHLAGPARGGLRNALTASRLRATVAHMKTLRLTVLAAGAALALACAPSYLPGTEIKDTAETRAIATLLETYRQAVEKRDVEAILALTTPDYFDNAGTVEPADDVNREMLATRLEELQKVSDVRLRLAVRGIEVEKRDEARAEVTFDQYYRVQTANGLVARHDNDIHRMTMKKVDGKWLFTGGL